jgi:hypothetical protein
MMVWRKHCFSLCLLVAVSAISTVAWADAVCKDPVSGAVGTPPPPATPPSTNFPPPPAIPWAPSGVSLTVYQNAFNKAFADAPGLIGPVFSECGIAEVFATGSASIWPCDFSYAVGIKDGAFALDISPPSSMSATIQDNGTIALAFDLTFHGSLTPYVSVDACGLSPKVAPPVTVDGIYGSISLSLSVQNHQIVVDSANTNVQFHNFNVDLGFLDDVLSVIGLDNAVQGWIQTLVQNEANKMVPSILPSMMTQLLQAKLDFVQTPVENFLITVEPAALETTANASITFQVDSSLEPQTPAPCATGDNCVEPTWPPTVGVPDTVDTISNADAAISVGMSAFNQALFGAWRSGILSYHQDLDAATVVGAIFPGLQIDGTATVDVVTGEAPTVSLPPLSSGQSDPSLRADNVQAHVHIVPETAGAMALDLYITTEFSATAMVEISPPEIGGVPNPTGNQIQFYATNFSLGTTTMQYGASSGLLTTAERDALINQLIIPQYQLKVGVLPLSSSILNFTVPGSSPPRRAALDILRKARAVDSLAVYVRFDVSPAGDKTPPAITIDTVDGRTPDPSTHEVLVGTHNPVATYSGSDDFSQFDDYITFETSTDDATWTQQETIRSIRVLNLNEGVDYLYVRGWDFAGNLSPDPKTGAPQAQAKMIVDTLPPTTAILSSPAAYINTTQAQVTYTGSDAGSGVQDYFLQLDTQAPTAAQTATSYTFTGLKEGVHTIAVNARDRLLHIDPVGMKARFTVDLTAPKTSLENLRTGYVKPSQARFAISATDNLSPLNLITYSYELGGPSCAQAFSPFASVATADLTGCALQDGSYTLTARAKDAAGNIDNAAATTAFIVDGTPPVLTLLDQPAARSTAKQLEFVLSATDNFTAPADIQYSYRLVGESNNYSTPTLTPDIVLDDVPSGDYEFQVTATDLADNQSPQIAYKFSLDNVAPTTTLNPGIAEWTNAASVPVALSGTDDRSPPAALRFSVSIDGGAPQLLSLPVSLDTLSEGEHTLQASAVDEFGNVDPVGVVSTFTVDRTPPKTASIGPVSDIILGTFRPRVSGTDNLTPEDQLRYIYRLSKPGVASEDWSTPQLSADFSIGLHEVGPVTIEIAAVDNAGNVDPQPLVVTGNVRTGSGCDCSAASGQARDLLPFAAFAFLFLARRRREY